MDYKTIELLEYLTTKRDKALFAWLNSNREENPKLYDIRYKQYLRTENMVETLNVVMEKAKKWDDSRWERTLIE